MNHLNKELLTQARSLYYTNWGDVAELIKQTSDSKTIKKLKHIEWRLFKEEEFKTIGT